MLNQIGLPMTLVVLLTITSQVFNILFLPSWGKIVDRFSNKSVLSVAGTILLVTIIAWTFTTLPGRYFLTIPLLFIVHAATGMTNGGIALATSNLSMKMSPAGEADSYIAPMRLVNAGAAFVAQLISGALATHLASRELSLGFTWVDSAVTVNVPTLA
jgi:MFS family permease